VAARSLFPFRLLKLLAFLLVQFVLVLILLEIFCRVADPLGISYYAETARYLDTMIQEEPIGYRNQPGLRGRYYGAKVEINSLGLRDRELPPAPDPGEFRILVMGDSGPFGIGVEFEDTLSQALERLATEHGRKDRRYRTVNMGVISYNSEQELIQLRTLGLRLHPDAAILFFADNDIEPKKWVFEKRSSRVADLAQRSAAIGLIFVLKREVMGRLAGKQEKTGAGRYREENPGWKSCADSLAEIHRICARRKIPFVVFAHRSSSGSNEALRALGEREGFPVEILADLWAREDRSKYVNSWLDGHPNRMGTRLYASRIHRALVELGVLP